jgi:hypothetical protein
MFNNQVIAGSSGQGGGFYDFPIEQSLRFNDNDSAYLSRTPASAGSLTTWTWSGWVKRGNLGITATLFSTATTNDAIYFGSGASNLIFYTQNNYWGGTAASFRDTSAWYHIVCVWDTTNATAADRLIIYVNNERQSLDIGANPALNATSGFNNNVVQAVGRAQSTANGYFDGYLADVNFIDGQALDPTSFGEMKSGIWTPVDTSGLTFGSNGFRLQFGDTTEASGFNALAYTGNGSSQSISGVGFSSSPDLVWIKQRTQAYHHELYDAVRGVQKMLQSSSTQQETTEAQGLLSFDSDGFTVGTRTNVNQNSTNLVAWCWDAGSGSAASNTDGSITSTVKANTGYGFSITSYTGNGTAGATVGHSLGVQPNMIIVKSRTEAVGWYVYHSSVTGDPETRFLRLDLTNAVSAINDGPWNNTAPSSSVITLGDGGSTNRNTEDYIAYCFAEKTGYSKFSSYTGTGSTGNSITGLGFAPAFVMIKRSDAGSEWAMYDNTRQTSNPKYQLRANASDAENSNSAVYVDLDSDGFTIQTTDAAQNASGGTYIYMAFADTRNAAFWRDTSGQGNDWQPNNLVFSDVVPDSTTNNFATMNPLMGNSSYVHSEGNTKVNYGSASWLGSQLSTVGMTSGKHYWEVYLNSASTSIRALLGIESSTNNYLNSTHIGNLTNSVSIYSVGTNFYEDGSATTDAEWVIATGDVVMFAYDADNGTLWIGKNGTWWNGATAAEISAGTTTNAMTSGLDTSLTWLAGCTVRDGGTVTFNFGQDSTFANNTAAGGNADENGYGDFKYAPPSGYLSLCSANLPTGAIDTLNDETPEDYFNTLLWTGDGSNPRTLSGLDFAPDLIWHKSRSAASMDSHAIQDSVRGFDLNNNLYTNLTGSETDYPNRGVINSVSSTGFTFNENASDYSTADGLNQSGVSYVAWNWKANGSGVSNTDGSITSTVSVSETGDGTKWFSVVGFTTQAGGYTVGHGLGQKPSLIITKNRDTAGGAWYTFTDIIDGSVDYLALNQTSAKLNDPFGLANPTSSVFSLDDDYIFGSGDCIAYCFANAEGLCKVGSFVGNGSTDGTFVFTGHKPSFLLIKNITASIHWVLLDNRRNEYNLTKNVLYPDLVNAEEDGTTYASVDFVSNGFKLRNSNYFTNRSGDNYIFLSIAEQPFKYSNAR